MQIILCSKPRVSRILKYSFRLIFLRFEYLIICHDKNQKNNELELCSLPLKAMLWACVFVNVMFSICICPSDFLFLISFNFQSATSTTITVTTSIPQKPNGEIRLYRIMLNGTVVRCDVETRLNINEIKLKNISIIQG